MKVKTIEVALTAIILFFNYGLKAQSYAETAGVFSRVNPGGSARIQAMGGAQIAIGGDYSSSLSNPAGLGMYNRSEVTFSPGFYSLKTSSSYLGTRDSEINTKINVPGFSAVFNNTKNCDCKGFLGGSFGISFSRVNDFNQSFQYHGSNQNNSIVDYFLAQATGDTPSQFDTYQYNTPTGLAYNNFLIGDSSIINPSAPKDQYFSDVLPTKNNPALQQENVQLKGATNQWNISYGANINDKFFFGAGLGITSLNYKSAKVYQEAYSNDPNFNSLQLNEDLSIKGSGANLTIGAIARPLDFLQVGASYTTPTLYQLSETYDASMSSSWKNFDYYGDGSKILNEVGPVETDIVKSDYTLVTPSKLSTGIAFISKYGLITGDVEMTNYGAARYSTTTTGVSYSEDNKQIRSDYARVFNYRIGAEGRYSIFRVRAGYNIQANTYKSEYDADNQIKSISGGVGVKTKKFSIDFALITSTSNGIYSPYTGAPTVNQSNNLTRGILTFGLTF